MLLLRPLKNALIAACVAAIVVIPAYATPIRPDVKHLLAEPQAPTQFVPARAGWQGPETPPAPQGSPLMKSAVSTKAIRASLIAAATPDPWAVLAIAAAILLLRWMRLSRGRQQLRPEIPEGALSDIRRAA